jgi:hypothetical protein
MTEQQPYTVASSHADFEIREYPAYVLAQVDVLGDFMSAGNMAFSPLVRYISGNNTVGQKMAMTAPVLQETILGNKHTVSFVLPAGVDPASLPIPRDARVRAVPVAAHRAAVRKFGGGWNEKRFMANAEALLAAVRGAGLATDGDVYFARFDPPWKPAFLKKNEALIRLV